MATRIRPPYPAAPLDFWRFENRTAPSSKDSGERRLRQVCFVLTDLMAVWLSAAVALFLRFSGVFFRGPGLWARPNKIVGEHIGVLLLYSGLIVLFCNTQRLYRGVPARSAGEETWDVGKAVGLATALQLACIYLSHLTFISCFVIVVTMVGSFLGLVAWRRLRGLRLQASLASDCRNVVLVGHGQQAQALHDD